MAAFDKLVQGSLVEFLAFALIDDLSIPLEAVSLKQAQDFIGMSLVAARLVQVFHSQQPLAAMLACIEITANGGNQGAEMQRPGRGGREAPDVISRAQAFPTFCDEAVLISFQPIQAGTR